MDVSSLDARACLRRARALLDEGTSETLLYAALELRIGVEVRMKEYLAAQPHLEKIDRKKWQVAKLGKTLHRLFQGDRSIRIRVFHVETHEEIYVLLYTPVTPGLRMNVERLGAYLHAPEHGIDEQKRWFALRVLCEETWQGLRQATRGNLLGLPMVHRRTRQITASIEFADEVDKERYIRRAGTEGSSIVVEVDYPESSESDAN